METTQSFETKIQLVLNHLQEQKSISSWEAITLYRATRLSAIIFVLKNRGHSITTEMFYEGKTRFGVYHYAGMDVIENGKVLGK
jgi:hypothetical protein